MIYRNLIQFIIIVGVIAWQVFFCTFTLSATPNHGISAVTYKDSLIAKDGVNLLTNRISITNTERKSKRVGVRTTVPKGWKNLAKTNYIVGEDIYYNLAPGENIQIPVNLLKLPDASPQWTKVAVKVWFREIGIDTQEYFYHIKADERKSFLTTPRNLVIEVDMTAKVINPSIYIKNTGNIGDDFTISYYNNQLNISDTVTLHLPAGKDTMFARQFELKNFQINQLSSEQLHVAVSNSSNNNNRYSYSLYHYTDEEKKFASPYSYIPIKLEGGYMTTGNKATYFGAVSGSIAFDKIRKLDFRYRSKQFGTLNTGFQRNVFMVEYKDKNWSLAVGAIQMPQYFLSNQFKAARLGIWTDRVRFDVIASIHDSLSFLKNDNIGIEARHRVGKIGIANKVYYNNNKNTKTNNDSIQSILTDNEFNIVSGKKLKVQVNAGAGADNYVNTAIPDPKVGLSAGYDIRYSLKHIILSSTVDYFDKNYPGINKGRRNMLHNMSYIYKNGNIDLFYLSNVLEVNYFRDSLYNTDILTYNTARYGVRFGNNFGRFSSMLSTGVLTFTGTQAMNSGTENYFVDVSGGYRDAKIMANLSGQTAFNSINGTDYAISAATTAFVNTRYLGLHAVYTRMPGISTENGRQTVTNYIETINAGPNVNFYLFRRKVFGSARYNVSKTLMDDDFVHGAGGSLNYNNVKNRLSVNLNCFFPFSSQTNDPGLPIPNRQNFQLSVTKQLNVPVITQRKYYKLKLTLFEDANNNLALDDGEKTIEGFKLLLDGQPFESNSSGEITYKNVSNGTYKLRMNTSNGLVPSQGLEQNVTVYKNTKVDIPFKSGKVLTGKVRVILDSLSKTKTAPNVIKIIARDAKGVEYYTFTDNNGSYKLTVLSGVYTISLGSSYASGEFKADKISFTVDLTKKDSEQVDFTIRQKKREIRFLKQ